MMTTRNKPRTARPSRVQAVPDLDSAAASTAHRVAMSDIEETAQWGAKIAGAYFEVQLDLIREKASRVGLRVEMVTEDRVRVSETGGGRTIATAVDLALAWYVVTSQFTGKETDLDADIF